MLIGEQIIVKHCTGRNHTIYRETEDRITNKPHSPSNRGIYNKLVKNYVKR